jgi:cystathionine gamma-lyase
MQDATRAIHAGAPDFKQGDAFLRGPTFAGPYHLAGDPASSPYAYGRFHNPTWIAYEQAITELERGSATVAFASGMAAVSAMLGATLQKGDTVVMPSDAYYSARNVVSGFFSGLDIQLRLAPTAGNAQLGHLKGARLVWLETPSNPGLDVCDIAVIAQAAHAEGALVVVDNTTPSCLGQQPLLLGADFSLSSDTKITTGHSDVVLGHITVRDVALGEKVRTWRTQMGSIPGPMEVWLAHRSLSTLHLRLERQSRNAHAVAEFLATRGDVRGLRYPGLPTDPAHAIAARQMKFFGPVVSFELASHRAADTFLRRCAIFYESTSFGGVHSSAERRARWGGDKVAEGFIRMSVGCEDIDDLIADLTQALDASMGE